MSERGDRDERLGAALRELEAPEHRPGFWEELDARLAEEGESREPAPGLRLLPPLRPSRWALAAGAVAAAIAAVVIGAPSTDTPEPALAKVVKERVADAIEGLETLQGRFSYRSSVEDPHTGVVDESPRRFSFAFTTAGDLRVTNLDGVDDTAYDSSRSIQRSVFPSTSIGAGRLYSERRGVAPGRPDQGPFELILGRELGAVVRALLAAKDPRVEETSYQGRPAWSVRLQVEPNAIAPDVDRIEMTIDQETGLPLRVHQRLDGQPRSELRVSDLEVNGALPQDAFEIRFPPGAKVGRTDEGFRRAELEDVAEIVGYEPLVPQSLPDGFTLSEVATARRPPPTGAEGGNPSRDVVSLSYRRGFDQVIVTTRRAILDPGRPELQHLSPAEVWGDPFGGEGILQNPEPVTLSAGALEGIEAELVVGPRSVPHIWALTDELVVTVSGNLTRAELLEATESLARG